MPQRHIENPFLREVVRLLKRGWMVVWTVLTSLIWGVLIGPFALLIDVFGGEKQRYRCLQCDMPFIPRYEKYDSGDGST